MKNYITMQEILIGNENKDFNNIFIYFNVLIAFFKCSILNN